MKCYIGKLKTNKRMKMLPLVVSRLCGMMLRILRYISSRLATSCVTSVMLGYKYRFSLPSVPWNPSKQVSWFPSAALIHVRRFASRCIVPPDSNLAISDRDHDSSSTVWPRSSKQSPMAVCSRRSSDTAAKPETVSTARRASLIAPRTAAWRTGRGPPRRPLRLHSVWMRAKHVSELVVLMQARWARVSSKVRVSCWSFCVSCEWRRVGETRKRRREVIILAAAIFFFFVGRSVFCDSIFKGVLLVGEVGNF